MEKSVAGHPPDTLHDRGATTEHADLLREFDEFANTASTADVLMTHIAQRLHEKLTRYNWVGFYLVDPHNAGVLVVGPYVGSFTPLARIPFDTGLCGAAARGARTVVVNEVRKDERYVAGSSMVLSEIVVPIMVSGRVAAELDINSYFPATFNKPEQAFVEACAQIVGTYIRNNSGNDAGR